jgi:ribosome-associated heat shock protein Hsp15
LYRTRTRATEACQAGEVRLHGERVKASKGVQSGVEFSVRRPGITRTYRVLKLLGHRVSAKEIPEYVLETTPTEEIEQLKAVREDGLLRRDRGAGRPTKRDRRMIERLFS